MLLVASFYASRPQRNSSRGKNIPLQMANNRQSNYTFGYLVWVCQIGCKPFDLQPISVIIVVEVTGLEPAASASRTQRSTKLSHTSLFCFHSRPSHDCLAIIAQSYENVKGIFCKLQKLSENTIYPLKFRKKCGIMLPERRGEQLCSVRNIWKFRIIGVRALCS